MQQKTPQRIAKEDKLKASQAELKRVGRVLTHGDGARLLEILKEMYYEGNLTGATPELTYQNLGRRDVVDFLVGLTKEQ